jgi:hypothetical protein
LECGGQILLCEGLVIFPTDELAKDSRRLVTSEVDHLRINRFKLWLGQEGGEMANLINVVELIQEETQWSAAYAGRRDENAEKVLEKEVKFECFGKGFDKLLCPNLREDVWWARLDRTNGGIQGDKDERPIWLSEAPREDATQRKGGRQSPHKCVLFCLQEIVLSLYPWPACRKSRRLLDMQIILH